MFLLECPNCGPRNAQEFRCGGEARKRPDLKAVTPGEWSDYVYMRDNALGLIREWWYHRAGCGLWFIAERHTKTHEVGKTYLWAKGQS
jgi:sarcosine oxidase subunit delta